MAACATPPPIPACEMPSDAAGGPAPYEPTPMKLSSLVMAERSATFESRCKNLETENAQLKQENVILKARVEELEQKLCRKRSKVNSKKKARKPKRSNKENAHRRSTLTGKYKNVKSRIFDTRPRQEILKRQEDERRKRESMGCTFRPTLIGARKGDKSRDSTQIYSKLYEDAQRKLKKEKQREEAEKAKEERRRSIANAKARKPGVLSDSSVFQRLYSNANKAPPKHNAGKAQPKAEKRGCAKAITERLFREAEARRKKKAAWSAERKRKANEKYQKECTFTTRASTEKLSSKEVTQRLFTQAKIDAEQRERMEKARQEELQKMANMTIKQDCSPKHERLYQTALRKNGATSGGGGDCGLST